MQEPETLPASALRLTQEPGAFPACAFRLMQEPEAFPASSFRLMQELETVPASACRLMPDAGAGDIPCTCVQSDTRALYVHADCTTAFHTA